MYRLMKQIFACGLLLASISLAAQKSKPENFAKTIKAADLKRHLYIIASKEMEGRETATEGQRKAANYIENHFRQLGLKPGAGDGYQQLFPIYTDSLLHARVEVNGQSFLIDQDFNININTSISATQRFSEAVFIGENVSTDSLNKIDLSGKLIVTPGNLSTFYDEIRKKGAAAVLTISNAYPRTKPVSRKSSPTLHVFKKTIGPQQFYISPAIASSINGGEELSALSSTIKIVSANILLNVQKQTDSLQSSNVLGMLEGGDLKDEYLFVTAHYDHLGKKDSTIYYGADDDGSGTVGVLELAEAFAKAKAAGKGPRRTIVFMTVSGEEKGLWGSEYYSLHPLFSLAKTTADLNIDMIGRIDPKRKHGDSTNYIYVVGDDKLSSDLRKINEAANQKYTKLELDYKYNDPNDKEFIYYRSDHYNFAKNGVPIIFYFNGTHADYHRPTDTPDKINYELMAKRARLVFFTAWEMANRKELLKRDLPLPILKR